MVDFSSIFNIVFVATCAALLVLLLVCTIVVAAKGKRKCAAGDVLLRILCVLVLIASAAMLAVSVLVMQGIALEILAEIPMPQLFDVLSSVIGFGLSAVLFILSLVALIVDCLVANKKTDKKKKDQPQKTPEQLKREAELERIRKIGESAVRKTSNVASADKSEKIQKTESSDETADPAAQEQDEPEFDWRTASEPKQEQTSFVGIKDEQSDFDSFDTFDDEQNAEAEDQAEQEQYESAEEPVDEVVEEVTDETVEEAEEAAEDVADEFADEAMEEATDEQTETEEIYYDDDEQFAVDGEVYDEQTEQPEAAEYDEYDGQEGAEGDEAYEYDETAEAEQYDEEQTDEVGEYDTEPSAEDYDEQPVSEEVEEAQYEDEPIGDEIYAQQDEPQAEEQLDESDIEPDRGIYIPEIRTVTRAESVPVAPVKKPAAKSAPKKPAAKRPAAKPKKPAVQKHEGKIPPEKRLPVTRRYVILDRHNAVNMFGEYLKERNQAEKDKLKSSINTIIIE